MNSELLRFNCCANAGPILSHFGNCYQVFPTQISSPELSVTQIQPGISFALQIIMTFTTNDSPSYSSTAAHMEGFYISIGDHMTSMDNAAVIVGPGIHVSINLALVRYVYDPAITFCTYEALKLSYTKGGISGVRLCKQECQVLMNLKFCGCSPIFANVQLSSDELCSIPTLKQCFFNSKIIYNATYHKALTECQWNKCPKLCATNLYVPFAVYTHVAPQHRTGDSAYETSVANIYFAELAYTLVCKNLLIAEERLFVRLMVETQHQL